MPKTSSIDMAIKAASELTNALKSPAPASPFHSFGDSTLAALDKLATIFEQAVTTEPTRVGKPPAKKQEPTKICRPSLMVKIQELTQQPRVEKVPDKNLHLIPLDEDDIVTNFQNRDYGTQKSVPAAKHTTNIQPTLIPNDMPRHKYNTRSDVGYANAVAILQRNEEILRNSPNQYIHHILHPETGNKCGYNQLVNNKVPGQSPSK